MAARLVSLGIAAWFIGLSAAGAAHAEDWPRWRGPRQDGISQETGLLKKWPDGGPRQLWAVPLTGGFSSVIVVDGRLFTQTKVKNQEVVLCLDAASGKERWRYAYECDYAAHPTFTGGGRPASRTGPRATPAYDAGRIFTVGSTGIVSCVDAKSGQKVWQQELLKVAGRACPAHGYCGSPLVIGDRVFVNPGGSPGKSLAALDKKDGRVLWQALDDPPGQATPVWAPFNGTEQVVFFTGTAAVGVAPADGKLLWRYPWKTRYDLNIATPICADDLIFISSNYGSGAALFRLNGQTEPETVWKSGAMQNHISTSIRHDGYLYGASETKLRCVEFRTGKIVWERERVGRASLVLVEGRLIVMGEHGELSLLMATPQAYTELSSCQVFDKQTLTWTVPVLSGGRLYVRSEDAVVALDLREAK